MIALALAGCALLVGMALAFAVPGARARMAVALASQGVAVVATATVVVPVLAGGAALRAQVPWSYPVESVTVVVDPLSAFFLAWSMPLTLLGGAYATRYLAADFARGRDAGPHAALLNLLQLSYLLVYCVQDTVGFLLGWELAAVSAWLLVIWSYREQKTRFAGFNYLVSTHVGLFLLAAGLMVLRARTGATSFDGFAPALSEPGPLRTTAFLVLGAAFALKAAFVPGHTWLPRAHAAAPAHVSALMSGVIHKAGLYGLLRFTLLAGRPEPWMGWTVLVVGAASAVVGALFSTTQRDLKRLLGYSSTENVGIAAMGFGVGTLGLAWDDPATAALGFTGGLLHVFNHAWFKCLLFYVAGSVYRGAHTVDLERLGGLARQLPRSTWMFALAGAAGAGLPPLNGFVSEFLVYSALYSGAVRSGAGAVEGAALVGFAAVLALVGALSAFALVRAFGIGFLGTPREPAHPVGGELGAAAAGVMWTHAVAIVALGLVPPLGGLVVAPVVVGFADPTPATDVLWALWAPVAGLAGLTSLAGAATVLVRARTVSHVTWACGYTAGTPRMQYTATSFAASLAGWFSSLAPEGGGVRGPMGWFPTSGGEVRTRHPDPVEQRIFSGLAYGESVATSLLGRLATEPRVVFSLGLVGLLVGIGLVVSR